MIKFHRIEADGSISTIRHPLMCEFGITESLAAVISSFLVADVGVGATTAATLGTVGAGALEGGAIGAITDPKNPLKGAEAGAITGGVASGISPVIGSTLGVGTTAADVLGGGIGGALGAAATGQNIGSGALTGGAGGAISSAINSSGLTGPQPAATSTPVGGPAGSAVSAAAPASVGAAAAPSPAEGLSDVAVTPEASFAQAGGTSAGIGTTPASSPAAAVSPSPTSGFSQLNSDFGSGTTPNATSGGTAGSSLGTGATPAPSIGSSPSIGTPAATSPAAAVSAAPAAAPAASPASTAVAPPSTGTGIGGWLKNNSWLLPVAALGYEATAGQAKLPGEAQLSTNAENLNAQAGQLENYFTSGTLPPGIQSGIDRASEAAKASIRSQYASIDPGGTSSAMAQDLANVDQVAAAQGSQIALNLLQQGVSEQGMANSLYTQIMNTALQQDQQLGSAIGTFASALAGGGTTIKLQAA